MLKMSGFYKTVALLVCTAALVGCGVNTTKSNVETEIVTIRLWDGMPTDAKEEAKAQQAVKEQKIKEKFPNINIVREPTRSGTNPGQEYDKALMAGIAPTAFDNFSYTTIPTRIANGTIADITELYNGWQYKNEMYRAFDPAISKDGKWYAIVRSAYVMGTTYNKKSIAAGGGDPNSLPATWAEFAALGQKITDASVPRFGYEIVGMSYAAWPFTAWVWSAGGDMVQPNGDGTYKITFNETAGVDAALFMNEMIWKYQMTQKDVLQDWNSIQKDIKTGAACFAWADLSWINAKELETYGDLKLEDFGVMAMPVKDASIDRPSFSGGEVVVFNPKASPQEIQAAFDVMSFQYYDEENLKSTWQRGNEMQVGSIQIPGRYGLYEEMLNTYTVVPQSIRDDMFALSKTAKAEPFCPNWQELKEALVMPLQEIMLNQSITREKVEQILDACAQKLYTDFPQSFRQN